MSYELSGIFLFGLEEATDTKGFCRLTILIVSKSCVAQMQMDSSKVAQISAQIHNQESDHVNYAPLQKSQQKSGRLCSIGT